MRRSLVEGRSLRAGGGSDGLMSVKVLINVNKEFCPREVVRTVNACYLCRWGRESPIVLVQPRFSFRKASLQIDDLIMDCLRLRRVDYVAAHRGSML
jgi:hypothetical protein